MKTKAKAVARKPSKAAKPLPRKRAVQPARARPTSVETVAVLEAADRDTLAVALGELVGIAGDMRELLTEIRDLLAEGAAEEEPEEGIETVVVTETEDL